LKTPQQFKSVAAKVSSSVRDGLAFRYGAVRQATETLAARLTPEDQMIRSMLDASPVKWHLAHTTWFFETFLLADRIYDYRHFDSRFTYLFNSYYKQLGGHPSRSIRGTFSRPSLEEGHAYRSYVDAAMVQLLEQPTEEIASLIDLGLNHEQQHQELIVTDIKHGFWTNPLRPAFVSPSQDISTEAAPLEWLEFDGGVAEIGHTGDGFAFDNAIASSAPSAVPAGFTPGDNADYLAFIEAGGYQKPELWLSDGWDQVVADGWRAPLYWENRDGEWWVFTTAGTRPLNLAQPACHLSFYEADAYARWRGWRLPTEAEWEIAAASVPIEGNFAESNRFDALAGVGAGLQQMFGDVWEWTSSPYVAYPGYRPPAGVLGEYNGKFMCGQVVLRGGSCATPKSHIRATYRNFFPPAARWQFTGVRPANDLG